MPKATAVLFGIEDEFDVLSVDRLEPGQIKIIIESVSREGPCPACGVISGRVKDRPLRRITDPCGERSADAAVVAERSPGLCRGAVPAEVVHPDE